MSEGAEQEGVVVVAEDQEFILKQAVGGGKLAVLYDALRWRSPASEQERAVILKMLRPEHAGNAALVELFTREVTTMASCDFKYIVPMRGIAWAKSPRLPILVMSKPKAQTLRAALARRKRFSQRLSVVVILSVLRSLQYLHEKGIVHRDVKPDNILLVMEPGDDEPRPTLAFFGVSKLIADADPFGEFESTPRYASREQLLHLSSDPSIDVYMAAMTLYEMLTGSLPYPEAKDDLQLARNRAHSRPPSLDFFARSAGEFPSTLTSIVGRALSLEPEDRYPTIAAFIGELLDIVDSLPAHDVFDASHPAPAAKGRTREDAENLAEKSTYSRKVDDVDLPVDRAAPMRWSGFLPGVITGALCGSLALFGYYLATR